MECLKIVSTESNSFSHPESVWHRISAESGDLSDLVEAGTKVAEIDGKINASERRVLGELRNRCEASPTT